MCVCVCVCVCVCACVCALCVCVVGAEQRLFYASTLPAAHPLTAPPALQTPLGPGPAHRYFSYEHFYVVYCKFWELDTDHDFSLDRADLARYSNCCLT